MRSEIAECCKRLRLSKNIVTMSEEVQGDTYQEYLLQILKSEVFYRQQRRRDILIKQAGFYSLKTFDGYSFEDIRLPVGLGVTDLKDGGFIEQKENLVFYGNVGTGKTHLAIAIGLEACKRGQKVLFYRTAALVSCLSRPKSS